MENNIPGRRDNFFEGEGEDGDGPTTACALIVTTPCQERGDPLRMENMLPEWEREDMSSSAEKRIVVQSEEKVIVVFVSLRRENLSPVVESRGPPVVVDKRRTLVSSSREEKIYLCHRSYVTV